MYEIENPAAELLTIVEAMRAQPAHKSALEVFALVFKAQVNDSIEISKKLISLTDLCRTAKLATKEHIFGDSALYLAPFNKFESFIHQINFSAQWSHYLPTLTEALVTELRFADHFLKNSISNPRSEKSITAAHLASKLSELLEECLTTDLDPKIKELFARHIQRLRSALDNYRIYGESAAQQILDETVGSIHRHSSEIKNQSDEGKDFITRVFDAIGRMNDLVAAPDSVLTLAATAVYFLPSLG